MKKHQRYKQQKTNIEINTNLATPVKLVHRTNGSEEIFLLTAGVGVDSEANKSQPSNIFTIRPWARTIERMIIAVKEHCYNHHHSVD